MAATATLVPAVVEVEVEVEGRPPRSGASPRRLLLSRRRHRGQGTGAVVAVAEVT
jgi:hypothetical protein